MKVGLVQINTDFGGQRYLPYYVGCLQAYAEKKLRDRYAVEFLHVEKIFPHRVRLSMKEKLSQIAIAYGESTVLVGSDGAVVARTKESVDTLRDLYPVVVVYSSSTASFAADSPIVAPALVASVTGSLSHSRLTR